MVRRERDAQGDPRRAGEAAAEGAGGALLAASFDGLADLVGGNRAVGSGFCPGDEFCDEPYFYISIYPEPYIPALPLLPPVGHWHSYKFIAALAPAHKIVASLDQPRDIADFDISINAALEALK